MISNVYHYYMSQYGNNKTASKYDTHKKSELRNIYNNIMQSNSKEPFYKIDLSVEAQKFAIDVKENALALSNVLNELIDEENQHSFKKMAYTSNPDALEVEFIGNNSMDYPTVEINVENIATPQINTGTYLNPTECILEPGRYSFDVDIANVTYEFQYSVSGSDTNLDVQNKLARLVNNSNIGLNASVATDAIGNTALVIQSNATGTIDNTPLIFSINDEESNFKGSVDALGLDSTTSFPQDAKVYVNGEPRTLSSNEFTLSKAYNIKLKSATSEPITLGLKADTESVLDNVRNIIGRYNSIIDLAQNSKPNSSTRKFYADFANVAKSYRNVLSSNGLNLADNGYINLDTDTFVSASNEEKLGSVLYELRGFNRSLQAKADNAVLNPMTYANKVIVSYKNPNSMFSSPYQTSAYAGMMFNGYI